MWRLYKYANGACPTPRLGRVLRTSQRSLVPRSARPAIICGTLGRAAPHSTTAHLFNLEVIGAQGLLDFLLGPARRCLHRAAEPVQHPLESELLHRERRPSRGSFVRGPLAPAAATSQPSAADSEPVLAEGRSVSPALQEPLLRRAARAAADADTRPSRRRSTKTRRGTASGMYGNAAAPTGIDSYAARSTGALGRQRCEKRRAVSEAACRTLALAGRKECDAPDRCVPGPAQKRDERILRMKARLAEDKFHS